jgi:hypothetical protein
LYLALHSFSDSATTGYAPLNTATSNADDTDGRQVGPHGHFLPRKQGNATLPVIAWDLLEPVSSKPPIRCHAPPFQILHRTTNP